MQESNMPNPVHEAFYTVPEVATKLRLDVRSIWRAISAGQIGSQKFGKARRISDRDLHAYIKKTRKGTTIGRGRRG